MVHFTQDTEPFEVDLSVETPFEGGPSYAPRCSYDLVSAVQRQREFIYNISLPHHRDLIRRRHAVVCYKVSYIC